jgi:hypothetical protein
MAYTTINKSTDYFNTKLYTGTGSSLALTGVGFQPDFTWIKCRTAGSGTDHVLFDAVRGVQVAINSNDTSANDTISNSLTAFGTDGFTVNGNGATGASGDTYVGWNWKAGGGQGSSNTDGSINTTYTSVNTTAGFSIVQYTGNGSTNQTVGHGLGAVPDFIIIKQTNTTRNWPTYSKAMGNGVAFLDITDAWNGGSGYTNYWYPSGMTSTTFGISNNDNNNQSGGTFIAYVFSSKTGYSKFGKYTGNANADGTFVYTGFKPAWLMVKRTDSTQDWRIFDSSRSPFNIMTNQLKANTSDLEGTSADFFDFTSNGFKIRKNSDAINASGGTYIYMAFGQSLVGTNNIPATAR